MRMRQILAVTASSFALAAAGGAVSTAAATAQSFGDLAVANDTHGDEHYNVHVEKTPEGHRQRLPVVLPAPARQQPVRQPLAGQPDLIPARHRPGTRHRVSTGPAPCPDQERRSARARAPPGSGPAE